MGSFDSPIGGKRFAGQQMKEIDVPDESGYYEGGQAAPSQSPFNVNQAIRQQNMRPLDEDGIRAFQSRLNAEDERDPQEVEREIRQAKADKRAGRERLNDGARRRIEMLLGMTRSTRSVNIGDASFILQTLKAIEMESAIAAAAAFDGTVRSPFEIRKQLLARSVVQVMGVDVEQFVGSNTLEAKLTFIDDMDDILLNRLYDEYLALVNEARAKYAIKKPEDAREVAEDLKK